MSASSRFLAYSIYQPEAIDETCVAFSDHAVVQRTREYAEGEAITITVLPGAPSETPEEFLSYLLTAACERHLVTVTEQ